MENRLPLREHPMFSRSRGSGAALQDISNVTKENYRRPLREHPIFHSEEDKENGQTVEVFALNHNIVKVTHNKRKFRSVLETGSPCTPVVSNSTTFESGAVNVDLCQRTVDAPCKISNTKIARNFPEVSRSLFESETQSEQTVDVTDSCDIEYSTVLGSEYSDDVMLTDDEEGPIDDMMDFAEEETNSTKRVPKEYNSLGGPTAKCEYCQAFMWKEERVNKNVTRGQPKFSLCCRKGLIKLPKAPPTPSFLWQIYNDPKKGPIFQQCSRIYNSMFCFTSTGGTVDNSINNGGGPYIYKVNGQNHHVFGSLIPDDGTDPKFCQLYIYDTENEVHNRMQWIDVKEGDKINSEIVEGLMNMLDEKNELVRTFRIARERYEDCPVVELKILLKVCRSQSGRVNNVGPSDEVAAIMVGDLDDPCASRDIIIESRTDSLQRITNIHPKLMALQYPVLFPHGEDGYHKDIKYVREKDSDGRKRENLTMKDFYSYKFQVRHNEGYSLYKL